MNPKYFLKQRLLWEIKQNNKINVQPIAILNSPKNHEGLIPSPPYADSLT